MTFNSDVILRLVRGIIGLVMVIAGIIYENFLGFIGAFLLISALGGCGMGSTSCPTNIPNKKEE